MIANIDYCIAWQWVVGRATAAILASCLLGNIGAATEPLSPSLRTIGLERICIAESGPTFETTDSKMPFHPWGFNYGNSGRLMEDFWTDDWQTFADDFREMKALGANVVRVHLQVNKFMQSPTEMNGETMKLFSKMLRLAEETGIYLDITGLACYRPSDTPTWYDALDETERWKAQTIFWTAIAAAGSESPAVFCYDLMNEPLSPSGDPKSAAPEDRGSWYSGNLFGGYDFLQRISLGLNKRTRGQVAVAWIDTLSKAIHSADPRALVTVGMLPWVTGWGHLSGMVPEEVAKHVDFLSVHIYPNKEKPDEAVRALDFCKGRLPVVIEETFPLSCSLEELEAYLLDSRRIACGWIWHYDGFTLDDYDKKQQAGTLTLSQAIYRSAIQSFVKLKPEMKFYPTKSEAAP